MTGISVTGISRHFKNKYVYALPQLLTSCRLPAQVRPRRSQVSAKQTWRRLWKHLTSGVVKKLSFVVQSWMNFTLLEVGIVESTGMLTYSNRLLLLSLPKMRRTNHISNVMLALNSSNVTNINVYHIHKDINVQPVFVRLNATPRIQSKPRQGS